MADELVEKLMESFDKYHTVERYIKHSAGCVYGGEYGVWVCLSGRCTLEHYHGEEENK
jgi:hypothetical protein